MTAKSRHIKVLKDSTVQAYVQVWLSIKDVEYINSLPVTCETPPVARRLKVACTRAANQFKGDLK